MATFDSTLQFDGELCAVINRADGSTEDQGIIDTSTMSLDEGWTKVKQSKSFWQRLFLNVREHMPYVLTASALAYAVLHGTLDGPVMALVTTAGINLLAADFVTGAGTHIAAFSYVDCGTGVTAAAITDTTLQTPAGTARVSGTQSTPVAGSYRVVATIPFVSSLAITEMGLFSAASAGTLWDHRIFGALNVNNGDSITFTYTVTCTAGGS
jgi:hypothetical protein